MRTYLVGLLAPLTGYRTVAIAYIVYGIQAASIFLGFGGTALLIIRMFVPVVDELVSAEARDGNWRRAVSRKRANYSRPAHAAIFASFALLFAVPAALNLMRWIRGYRFLRPIAGENALANLADGFTSGLVLHIVEFTILVLIIPILGIAYARLDLGLRASEGKAE